MLEFDHLFQVGANFPGDRRRQFVEVEQFFHHQRLL